MIIATSKRAKKKLILPLLLQLCFQNSLAALPNESEFKRLCRSDQSEEFLLIKLKQILKKEKPESVKRWLNNPLNESNMMTPLHWLASYDHAGIAEHLIKSYHFILEPKDNADWTPLFWAIVKNNINMATLIISHSLAQINSRDMNNSTVLHYAARHGHIELVKILLEKGADRQAKNNQGHTPLDYANMALSNCSDEDLRARLMHVTSLLQNHIGFEFRSTVHTSPTSLDVLNPTDFMSSRTDL